MDKPAALASPAAVAPQLVDDAVRQLVAEHGPTHKARIEQGVKQVASLWRPSDGDLGAFCLEHFVADAPAREQLFARFEAALEQTDGHFLEIGRELRRASEVDVGPMLPIDELFAGFDASAHLLDDLFASKIAFVALLNFPLSTLDQRLAIGAKWSRAQWAQARLTSRFSRRVPAEVLRRATEVQAKADLYIANYNLWMHHVLDERGRRVFPSGKRLISHWNLRDELKAQYAAGADGTNRQRVIVRLMERIVTQTIPLVVINNPRVDYDPFSNHVTPAPPDTIEQDAPAAAAVAVDATPEPSTRYAQLLAQFHAARAQDPFSPTMPNAIQRSFELGRELPEARVARLFGDVLGSPLVGRVAAEIQRRLGRPLEPQDLWYDGFKARSSISEATLDQRTRKRYPTSEAYRQDMPRLLADLGFSKAKARFLAEHILVDPSRGAGHAMQAARRGDFPRLRTRVEKGGMNYKGYNIAVHEMGHNVEQVFSLYGVDHTLLAGVPNNAFTEALAFVFQARDLELLGEKPKDAAATKREAVLADFWATWEIAGVALVDVAVWHWLYDHPHATPHELRDAVVAIATDVWARHYQPVLGDRPSPLLGIYSHMIEYPLYLTDYPLGHLIAFQIEEQLERAAKQGKRFGDEVERMAVIGNIAPDLWMTQAAGGPVSAEPLLRATERALAALPPR
ncbi:MAG: hypothetical protein A2138_12080 [Deltaproteobacteria bacterium RBG_16_71_12]|nr:MAG: hypothetical protein A2138_12080 [Deltaproteobacteria bacterium RBG_16_71_12]